MLSSHPYENTNLGLRLSIRCPSKSLNSILDRHKIATVVLPLNYLRYSGSIKGAEILIKFKVWRCQGETSTSNALYGARTTGNIFFVLDPRNNDPPDLLEDAILADGLSSDTKFSVYFPHWMDLITHDEDDEAAAIEEFDDELESGTAECLLR